ncbi:unnamed protein product, partial [Iphiclides podalirius]
MGRSIYLWLKTGRRHSEVLDEQKLSEGQLRRPGATIILWLKCEQAIHDERLNRRVDSMLKEGLIEELLGFHERHNKQRIKDGKPPDYTKGVFQTLGFKEFHEYLMLPEEQRNSDKGRKLLEDSIEVMKMSTRRYARRQNKMVKGRFLDIPTREVPPIYELDTTDLSNWNEHVKFKAIEIIESYINEVPCPYEPLKRKVNEEKLNINGHSSNFCELFLTSSNGSNSKSHARSALFLNKNSLSRLNIYIDAAMIVASSYRRQFTLRVVDWRSPGEEWVKTQEGWEKKKVLECTTQRYAAISNFNNIDEKQQKWKNLWGLLLVTNLAVSL